MLGESFSRYASERRAGTCEGETADGSWRSTVITPRLIPHVRIESTVRFSEHQFLRRVEERCFQPQLVL
jgi:hypothetical protein